MNDCCRWIDRHGLCLFEEEERKEERKKERQEEGFIRIALLVCGRCEWALLSEVK